MNKNEAQQPIRIVVVDDGRAELERAFQLRRRLGPNASILLLAKDTARRPGPANSSRRSLAA